MPEISRVPFCILLAAPRSGTQLLGRAAEAAFGTRWLQEVFNDIYSDPSADLDTDYDVSKRASYFNFRYHELQRRPELAYPSIANQRTLFEAYLQSVARRFDETSFLMDIKYNSWHHLNDYWSYPAEPPGLVAFIRELRIPVVHLLRENLFAQYCSVELARETGIWYSTEAPVRSGRLRIDVESCRYWMGVVEQSIELFERWFDGHPVYRLTYERMIGTDGFSPHVTRVLGEALQTAPIAPIVTDYVKVTPNLCDVISNPDDVRSYFRRSKYRHMVEHALRAPARAASAQP